MTTPQPVFQHPFRSMSAELHDVAREVVETISGMEMDNDNEPDEASSMGRVLRVARELSSLANALDITQGNSDANGYARWAQDMMLPHALESVSQFVKRYEAQR